MTSFFMYRLGVLRFVLFFSGVLELMLCLLAGAPMPRSRRLRRMLLFYFHKFGAECPMHQVDAVLQRCCWFDQFYIAPLLRSMLLIRVTILKLPHKHNCRSDVGLS